MDTSNNYFKHIWNQTPILYQNPPTNPFKFFLIHMQRFGSNVNVKINMPYRPITFGKLGTHFPEMYALYNLGKLQKIDFC